MVMIIETFPTFARILESKNSFNGKQATAASVEHVIQHRIVYTFSCNTFEIFYIKCRPFHSL